MDRVATATERLYQRPLTARRSGALFNSFSYPTKIDAEAIALFIAVHTDPGATVLDPFGGSGSTGIAARLCDCPTERMRDMAHELSLAPEWGPRHAVISEISPIGVLLASVMCDPPDPDAFMEAASALVNACEQALGWLYKAADPEGEGGLLRHAIWSDVLITPCCGERVSLWAAAVELSPAVIRSSFVCPACGTVVLVRKCERVVATHADPFTGQPVTQRARQLARIYGRSGKRTWSRPPTAADRALAARIAEALPGAAPAAPHTGIVWGDLRRAGYHLGIESFHHLYTPRNLTAVSALWEGIDAAPHGLREALRLLVLSYNATHATQLTRVVAKRDQPDLVVSGAQTGVLYLSGLPVEKNVFTGVRRKIKTFADAFALTAGSSSDVRVIRGSSTKLDLPSGSVDYVFTDPPFGGYIPYAEINQINEAWLGVLTDRTEEAIVSPAQEKDVAAYGNLLSRVFGETARVLRPSGVASVVFHSSSPAVWAELRGALASQGFVTERSSSLERDQPTFKQATSGAHSNTVLMLRNATGHLDTVTE